MGVSIDSASFLCGVMRAYGRVNASVCVGVWALGGSWVGCLVGGEVSVCVCMWCNSRASRVMCRFVYIFMSVHFVDVSDSVCHIPGTRPRRAHPPFSFQFHNRTRFLCYFSKTNIMDLVRPLPIPRRVRTLTVTADPVEGKKTKNSGWKQNTMDVMTKRIAVPWGD